MTHLPIIEQAFLDMHEAMASTPKRPTREQFRRCREAIMFYYAVVGGTMWEIDDRRGKPLDVGIVPSVPMG